MTSRAALFRTLRAIHLYVGVLIAPALLFFAFTGALQTFGMHENSREGAYKAPRWAVVLGQIHKKQTAIVPARRPFPDHPSTLDTTPRRHGGVGTDVQSPSAARMNGPADTLEPRTPRMPDTTPDSTPPSAPAPRRHALPLKIFFLIVSVALAVSTVTGVYMTFLYKRKASLIIGLLLLGTLLPIVLVFV
jgi:hypothetical protein